MDINCQNMNAPYPSQLDNWQSSNGLEGEVTTIFFENKRHKFRFN